MVNEQHKSDGFLGQKMFVLPPAIRQELEDHPIGHLLYITDIGYFPKAKHHSRERKNGANEDILIFCIEGKGEVSINNENITVKANEFCLIKKGISHSYKTDPSHPWSIYWIHFDGLKAEEIFRNTPIHHKISLRSSIEQGRIAMFNDFFKLLEAGISTEKVLYISMQLWALMSSFVFSSLYTKDLTEKSITDKAIKFMKENLNNSITLDEVALHVKRSSSHLSATFKHQTGHSPLNYFILLKMQEACRLLSLSKLSIKEIAFILGYTDPYYFSRIFKSTIGLSPKNYRLKEE